MRPDRDKTMKRAFLRYMKGRGVIANGPGFWCPANTCESDDCARCRRNLGGLRHADIHPYLCQDCLRDLGLIW